MNSIKVVSGRVSPIWIMVALFIVFGFILAAMIDKEKRGESLFR